MNPEKIDRKKEIFNIILLVETSQRYTVIAANIRDIRGIVTIWESIFVTMYYNML